MWKLPTVAAGCICVALIAAGCGSGDDASAPAAATTSAQTCEAATARYAASMRSPERDAFSQRRLEALEACTTAEDFDRDMGKALEGIAPADFGPRNVAELRRVSCDLVRFNNADAPEPEICQ
jgi:hypothetical protein